MSCPRRTRTRTARTSARSQQFSPRPGSASPGPAPIATADHTPSRYTPRHLVPSRGPVAPRTGACPRGGWLSFRSPTPATLGQWVRRTTTRCREAGKLPTGRLARTARVGGLVTGQGLRWAGMRTANRVRTPERAAAAQNERTAALVGQLVDQLGQMRGAAMKVGQMISMVEFDGLPEDERDELQRRLAALRDDVPPVRVRGAREADAPGVRRSAGARVLATSTSARSPRPRSVRSIAPRRSTATTWP